MSNQHKLNLKDLLSGIIDAPPIAFNDICDDSRLVNKGDVFFALQGIESHGCDFIDSVIDSNAAAIIYEPPYELTHSEDTIPIIPVDNLRSLLGKIANRYYDYPSKSMNIIGVTGTNGKTTVAWLIKSCLNNMGYECGYVGTLGYGIESLKKISLTTPSCISLHKILFNLSKSGAKYSAIEVSSHAIEQNRISGVEFDSVIFTNLSRDHIDYHNSMEEYGAIKARLFTKIKSKVKIINISDSFGQSLSNQIKEDVIVSSIKKIESSNYEKFISLEEKKLEEFGYTIRINSSWGDKEIVLPFIGEFNIENSIQVFALLLSYDFSLNEISDAIKKCNHPKGRMQLIQLNKNYDLPKVFVDFSHTPSSLNLAINAIRDHFHNRKIWCVFGCGGNRDRGKRRLMGKIAEENADYIVVTSDNPRNEDPDAIILSILEGITSDVQTIKDRSQAIEYAVMSADKKDIILIAGKGHENFQITKNKTIEFSDQDISSEALKKKLSNIQND